MSLAALWVSYVRAYVQACKQIMNNERVLLRRTIRWCICFPSRRVVGVLCACMCVLDYVVEFLKQASVCFPCAYSPRASGGVLITSSSMEAW